MRVLLLDNYDSFTYNLVQLLRESGVADLDVVCNDHLTITGAGVYDAVVISPGPGLPHESGITSQLIRTWAGRIRIFGVCLGMQAIAEVFGARLYQPPEIMHGEMIRVMPAYPVDPLFAGLEQGFDAGLYHSWAVEEAGLPAGLRITARDRRGVIMGLAHEAFDVCGVQFHPESIMTPSGRMVIENWLSLRP